MEAARQTARIEIIKQQNVTMAAKWTRTESARSSQKNRIQEKESEET